MGTRVGALGRRMAWAALLATLAAAAPAGPGSVRAEEPATGVDRLERIDRTSAETRERLERIRRRAREVVRRADAERVRLARLEARVRTARRAMAESLAEHRRLSERMGDRAREAYMRGPGSLLDLLGNADSLAEVGFGIYVLDHMNTDDRALAERLRWAAALVAVHRSELRHLAEETRSILRGLRARERRLERLFREQERLLRRLAGERAAVVAELNRTRPLWVCPVAGPNAFNPSFGYRRPESAIRSGKMPVHRGVDVFAAHGTPVVAPFDGVVVDATNPVGGLAVEVRGPVGSAYHAHLSGIARLGPVSYGTVIGWVGTTGNARGTSPHVHFEWHPGGGAAVDPYPLLAAAC